MNVRSLPSRDEPVIPHALQLTCFALCTASIVYLVTSWFLGQWLMDLQGHGVPVDFVNVWTAGQLATGGKSALAYDWAVQKQLENLAIGYDFPGHFGWHYPPPFLFVASALSLLPYAAAFVVWIVITLLPYLGTVRLIVGHRFGWLLAAACPAALSNIMVGQNGFLTASLIGGAVGLMERHPALAGVCLGCLTYKPQFGVLFPIVLIAGGRWRVIIFACATAALVAVASWLAYGSETWAAFLHWLPTASKAFLTDGLAGWDKLQSVYGLTRVLGGGDGLAWTLQLSVALVTALVLVVLWRRKTSFGMKTAALATGTLLATPYVYMYDMVILAIPAAFLIRAGLATGFYRYELSGLGVAAAALFVFPIVTNSVGLLATATMTVLIARRCLMSHGCERTTLPSTSGPVLATTH